MAACKRAAQRLAEALPRMTAANPALNIAFLKLNQRRD
jgi:hypothetical protein